MRKDLTVNNHLWVCGGTNIDHEGFYSKGNVAVKVMF